MSENKKVTKEMFDAIMMRLANLNQPFYFMAKSLSVHISDEDNYKGEPAITFGNKIVLYRDFTKMNWEGRETYMIHLILHWIKRHTLRNNDIHIDYEIDNKFGKEMINKALNFVEDCQLDWLMKNKYTKAPRRYEEIDKSGFKVDWDREALEQIIKRLMDEAKKELQKMITEGKVSINVISTGEADQSGLSEEVDGMEQVQEGEIEKKLKKAKSEGKVNSAEDEESMVKDHIRTKIMAAKQAGRGQDDIISKLAGEFEPPEVPWYRIVQANIQHYLKSFSDSTWGRTGRRSDDVPGEISYNKPKVWVCVDTSGSVDDFQMMRFWSETAGLLPYTSGIEFIQWDDGIHSRKTFRRGEILEPFRSSGGTQFAPVITELYKEFKRGDILVCLTDGYWSDCEEEMNSLKSKHMKTVLVTTAEERIGFKSVYHVNPAENALESVDED